MNSVDKTGSMLYRFCAVLIFGIIFCLLAVTAPAKPNTVKNGSSASMSSRTPVIKTGVAGISAQDAAIGDNGRIVYGKSGLGAELACYKIRPTGQIKHKILMTYEIHGYEDLYPKDGQYLVTIANGVVSHFKANPAELCSCALYIVPSVNPDGLSAGTTKDGKGRCQITLGIDLNRDFDYHFVTNNDSRNHTLAKPFSAPESAALRDLVNAVRPDVIIDDHGWGQEFFGDRGIAGYFTDSLGIHSFSSLSANFNGYFSAWASTRNARALLIEYPKEAYGNNLYITRTYDGIKKMAYGLSRS